MDSLTRQICAEVENVEAALRNLEETYGFMLEEVSLASLVHNIPEV